MRRVDGRPTRPWRTSRARRRRPRRSGATRARRPRRADDDRRSLSERGGPRPDYPYARHVSSLAAQTTVPPLSGDEAGSLHAATSSLAAQTTAVLFLSDDAAKKRPDDPYALPRDIARSQDLVALRVQHRRQAARLSSERERGRGRGARAARRGGVATGVRRSGGRVVEGEALPSTRFRAAHTTHTSSSASDRRARRRVVEAEGGDPCSSRRAAHATERAREKECVRSATLRSSLARDRPVRPIIRLLVVGLWSLVFGEEGLLLSPGARRAASHALHRLAHETAPRQCCSVMIWGQDAITPIRRAPSHDARDHLAHLEHEQLARRRVRVEELDRLQCHVVSCHGMACHVMPCRVM